MMNKDIEREDGTILDSRMRGMPKSPPLKSGEKPPRIRLVGFRHFWRSLPSTQKNKMPTFEEYLLSQKTKRSEVTNGI